MARFRFTATARTDLQGILAYIAADSPTAATRMLARFERQARILADNPGIGRPREDLRPALRSFAVGSYLLFYRAVADGIEIVRVLHGRRDIGAVFADESS
jgi:toxin ParE1/3/4